MATQLEPLYPTGRNLFFNELGIAVSFVPYRPLPSLPEFPRAPVARSVLVDVGTNGFYASAKHLIDMYEPHMPFTDVWLLDPDDKGMAVPPHYQRRHNVRFLKRFVEVGTRERNIDVLVWLHTVATKQDHVVLKFDVDEAPSGSTIEWGFLSDLYYSRALELVDELYIELHFLCHRHCHQQLGFKPISWRHEDHSMRQMFDVLREMRRCGVAVHAWP